MVRFQAIFLIVAILFFACQTPQLALFPDVTNRQSTYRRIQTYKTALRKSPTNVPLLLKLANIYFAQGFYNEAAPLYRKVLTTNATSLAALYPLGKIEYISHRLNQAAGYFERAYTLLKKPYSLIPDRSVTAEEIGLWLFKIYTDQLISPQTPHPEKIGAFEKAYLLNKNRASLYIPAILRTYLDQATRLIQKKAILNSQQLLKRVGQLAPNNISAKLLGATTSILSDQTAAGEAIIKGLIQSLWRSAPKQLPVQPPSFQPFQSPKRPRAIILDFDNWIEVFQLWGRLGNVKLIKSTLLQILKRASGPQQIEHIAPLVWELLWLLDGLRVQIDIAPLLFNKYCLEASREKALQLTGLFYARLLTHRFLLPNPYYLAKATDYLHQWTQIKPADFSRWTEIAALYIHYKKWADLKSLFEKYIGLANHSSDSLANVSKVYRHLRAVKRYQDELHFYSQFDSAVKANPRYYLDIAICQDHLRNEAVAKKNFKAYLTLAKDPKRYKSVMDYFLKNQKYEPLVLLFEEQIPTLIDFEALFLLAKAYRAWGKIDKEEETFNQLLRLAKDNPKIAFQIIEHYVDQGAIPQAEDLLKKMLAQGGPDNVRLYYQLARLSLRTGDRSKSRGLFEKALAASSQKPALLAKILADLSRQVNPADRELIPYFSRRLLQYQPENTNLLWNMANHYLLKQRYEVAAAYFQQLVQLSVHKGEMALKIGSLFQGKSLEQAVAFFKMAQTHGKVTAQAYFLFGEWAHQKNRRPLARKNFQLALQALTQFDPPLREKANKLLAWAYYDLALKAFRLLQINTPALLADDTYKSGLCYLYLNRVKPAQALFNRFLSQVEANDALLAGQWYHNAAKAYYAVAQAFFHHRHFQTAVPYFIKVFAARNNYYYNQQATQLIFQLLGAISDEATFDRTLSFIAHQIPDKFSFYQNGLKLFEAAGNLQRRVTCLRKMVEIKPQDPESLFELAQAHYFLKAPELAERFFEKYIQVASGRPYSFRNYRRYPYRKFYRGYSPYLDKPYVPPYTRIGDFYFQQQQFPKALRYYRLAEKNREKSDHIGLHQGVIHLYQKREMEALAQFDRALSTSANVSHTAKSIGDLFRFQGRLQTALKYYQIGLSQDPRSAQTIYPEILSIYLQLNDPAGLDKAIDDWIRHLADPPQDLLKVADLLFRHRYLNESQKYYELAIRRLLKHLYSLKQLKSRAPYPTYSYPYYSRYRRGFHASRSLSQYQDEAQILQLIKTALLQLKKIALKTGETAPLLALLKQVYRECESKEWIAAVIGDILVSLNKPKQAIRYYQRSIQRNQPLDRVLKTASKIVFLDPAKGLRQVQMLLKKELSPGTLDSLAQILVMTQQTDWAVQIYRQLLAKNPQVLKYYIKIAAIHFDNNQPILGFQEIQAYSDAYQSGHPRSGYALRQLSDFLIQFQRIDEGLEWLKKFKDPPTFDIFVARFSLYIRKDLKVAAQMVKQLSQFTHLTPLQRLEAGHLLFQYGFWREAIPFYQRVLQFQPVSLAYSYGYMGDIYYRTPLDQLSFQVRLKVFMNLVTILNSQNKAKAIQTLLAQFAETLSPYELETCLSHLVANHFHEAARDYIARSFKKPKAYLLLQLKIAYFQGDAAFCAKLEDQILSRSAQRLNELSDLIQFYQSLRAYSLIPRLFKRYSAEMVQFPKFLYEVGRACLVNGQLKEGLVYLNGYLEKSPNSTAPFFKVLSLLTSYGYFKTALKYLNRPPQSLLDSVHRKPQILLKQIEIQLALRNYSKIPRLLKKYLPTGGKDGGPVKEILLKLLQIGQYQTAASCIAVLQKHGNSPQFLRFLEPLLALPSTPIEKQKQSGRAIFNNSLPSEDLAIGSFLLKLGFSQAASRHFQRFLQDRLFRSEGSIPELLQPILQEFGRQGQIEAGLSLLNRFKPIEAEAYQYLKDSLLLSDKNQTPFENALRKRILIEPKNANLINALAYLYARRGTNLDKALELIKKAIRLNLNRSVDYYDTLGWIYYKRGQLRAAQSWLLKAFSRINATDLPSLCEIAYHLGRLYEKWGKPALAKKYYRIGLSGPSQNPYREYSLNRLNRLIQDHTP